MINGTDAAKTLTGNPEQYYQGLAVTTPWQSYDILIGTGNDILNGGTGSDTASYAQATSGIIANLKKKVVTRIAKIMPLGDSITYGKVKAITRFS